MNSTHFLLFSLLMLGSFFTDAKGDGKSLPPFGSAHWKVSNILGQIMPGYQEYESSDPISISAYERMLRLSKETIYPFRGINEVHIFTEGSGNTERFPADHLYVYLGNSDEQIIEQLSDNPYSEPALRGIYNKQKIFLETYLGQTNSEIIFEHCLHQPVMLPKDVSFYSAISPIFYEYRHVGAQGHWWVQLLRSSCLIKSARIFPHSHNIAEAVVLMDRRFEPIVYQNYVPVLPKKDICLRQKCQDVHDIRAATRVGIVDSGVDYNSPYLVNSLIPSNGRTFPYLGYDFLEEDELPYDVHFPDQYNLRNVETQYVPRYFLSEHGTGVSHLVVKDAPELAIIPARVVDGDYFWWESRQLAVDPKRIAGAIDYLAQNEVKCINLSLYFFDKTEQEIITREIQRYPDVVFIFAAGNFSWNFNREEFRKKFGPNSIYTRDYPNVIMVGSVNPDLTYAPHSNFGNSIVHMGAVGTKVRLLLPNSKWKEDTMGTSYAAPLVTRTCGKIRHMRGDLSGPLVKQAILEAADRRLDLTPYFSQGRVLNENAALLKIRQIPVVTPR